MSRPLLLGLIAGTVLRLAVLTNEGTPDTGTWKLWSFAGASDPIGSYGVGGTPPERRLLRWGDIQGTTEYPPLALYELAAVGRVYRLVDPTYQDSTWLTVLIKLPGMIAEVALVGLLLLWGPRVLGPEGARWMALALWLNPAIWLNGAALGYLDAQMAVPAVGALLAVIAGRPGIAGVLAAVAVLTKVQAVFVGPALLLALARQAHWPPIRAVIRFVVGGVLTALAVLWPIVWHGAWRNMVQAIERIAAHDMLSGYAMNAWWIITWAVRASYAAPEIGTFEAFTDYTRILTVTRFVEVGFVNPKPIAAVLVIGLIAWAAWRYRRSTAAAAWAYVGGWSVLTYFLWNVQVHENHLFLAVPLLALAAALDRRCRPVFWAVSVTCAANMYLFYGLGDGHRPIVDRLATGVDLTVLGSFALLAVWCWITWRPLVSLDDRPIG